MPTHVSGDVADKDTLWVLVRVVLVGLLGVPPCTARCALPRATVGTRLLRWLGLPAAILVCVVVSGRAAPGPIRLIREIGKVARRLCAIGRPVIVIVIGFALVSLNHLLRLGGGALTSTWRGRSVAERLRHRLLSLELGLNTSLEIGDDLLRV